MSRSARLLTAALLAAAMLPVTALPALAATEVVAAPLPAPTGLTPVEDPDVFPHQALKDVILSWNAVAGATGYRVEIGTDDTWSGEADFSGDTSVPILVPPVGLPHATYVWRVAALKGQEVGHWTSEATNSQNRAQFTRGWQVPPGTLTVSAAAGPVAPEFSWASVPEADSYEFQISPTSFTQGSPAAPPVSADTGPTAKSQLSPGVTQCVTARNRITPFELLSSANSQSATGCKLPDGFVKGFARVRPLDAPVDSFAGGSTDPSPVGQAPNSAEAGNWSNQVPFEFTPAAPGAMPTVPVVTKRLTGADDVDKLCTITNMGSGLADHATCSDAPSIRWDQVTGANAYLVTVARDPGMGNVALQIITQGTTFTTNGTSLDGSPSQSYYYAVQACNTPAPTFCALDPEFGVHPPGSVTPPVDTPPSYRKVSPALTNLSTPDVRGPVVLTWDSYAKRLAAVQKPAPGAVSPSQDAAAYRVQIAAADHPSYDVTVLDETVDAVASAPNRFTASGGQTFVVDDTTIDEGKFVWRVQTVDSGGYKLPWSASRTFTRDAKSPLLIKVVPSTNVAAKSPLKLEFSEEVSGISASSVVLSPAVPANVVVTGPSTATLTPTKAMVPGARYTIEVGPAVKDVSGNSALPTGPSFIVNLLADDTSPAISYSSGWRPFSATNAIGGRYYRSSPTAASKPTASMTFHGTGVSYYACMGPTYGYVDIYIDGTRRIRKSLYRSYSGCGIKIYAITKLPKSNHTIKLVSVGAKIRASRGNEVAIDALQAAF